MTSASPSGLDSSSNREIALRWLGAMSSLHWFVVLTSLALTLFAYQFSRSQIDERNAARFEREVEQVVQLVGERMSKYEDGLWGGVGLFMGSDHVSLREWTAYAKALDLDRKYPGINGIGVIRNAGSPEALAELEHELSTEQPGFRVHPARRAEEYFPIVYIVPQAGNEQAVGLDVAHEANRYAAARQARDTGESQITGPIVLVQDADRTPGFLFYAPFYRAGEPAGIAERRERFQGLVYAPFVMRKLMEGTLAAKNRRVRVRITDVGTSDRLYDEHGAGTDDDPQPMFQSVERLGLFGRVWEFDTRSTLAFRQDAENELPATILIGGIVIDVLLAATFLGLSRGRKRALELADELRDRSLHLERTNAELDQFASAVSHDLKAPLRGVDALVDWLQEDCGEALSPTGRDYIVKARELIARMNELLDDLLSYARLGTDSKEPEPIDLREAIAETLDWLSSEREVEVDVDPSVPETLSTGRAELLLVLRNLIQNAIKHSDRDEVHIEVGLRQISEQEMVLYLRDDGPGVPVQFAEAIFGMFRKLKSRDEVEGSGIGLAMVRKVMEARGGWIRLVEREGRGAEFEIGWRRGF